MRDKFKGRRILKTPEAAEYLEIVTEKTLINWRSKGRGPKWVKLGDCVGYQICELDKFLDDGIQVPNENFVA